MPEVSIIMPVYNGEKYIKESIESIIAQTMKDWELWLVNDCSKDHSLEIMKEYEKNDPRIHVVSNAENLKLPRTLNAGFAHAQGNYFTWTSDDNRYRETAIETMVNYLNANPECGMVYCDMQYIDEEGIITGSVSKNINELYCNDCIGACFLYRNSVARDVGEYDPEMFLVEDYEYWIRISKKYPICHLPEFQYFYRVHQSSLTQKRADEINRQLYKLRRRELDFILSRIDEQEKKYLFFDMLAQNRSDFGNIRRKFYGEEKLPSDIRWIERKLVMDESKKIILFGAGDFGRKALDYFGEEKVAYFVDNNADIAGKTVCGKMVLPFDDFVNIQSDYQTVISVDARKAHMLARQLEENGIIEFTTYLDVVNNLKKPSVDGGIDYIKSVKKAAEWIEKNTIAGEGIINNTLVRKSYPEVTGYYIPTLLRWGFRGLALQYAKWLCQIQAESGAWYDTIGTDPYVFDTAQVLKGLLAIRELYPEADVHIRKGCDWLVSNIDEDGRLVTSTKKAWGEEGICSELIHLYCLSPLIEAAGVYQVPAYREAAQKTADYYITNHKEDILNFNILSHFYAYIMEALCDIGETELARQGMEKMADIQADNGMIPAYRNVNWVCSTGMFQLAITWYKLGDMEHGDKAFSYAAHLQNESGGWFGSYATVENPKAANQEEFPDYFREGEISWAVKYFLDAVYYKCKCEFEEQADTFQDFIKKEDGRYCVILAEAAAAGSKKICDVGCGKGRYIRNLMEDTKDKRFYAVDLSERVMESIGSPVEKRCGSLTNIPYPDGEFDLVYTVEALEHAVIPENAVKEMLRVLKKRGKAVIIDKNKAAMGLLEIDAWEQWFEDSFFQELADECGCSLEIKTNIPYESGFEDGLFNAWIFTKNS